MRYALLMSLALCLAMPSELARASVQHPLIEGDIPTCVVERGMGAFDIPVHESVITALHFPGHIKREVRSSHGNRHFKVGHKKDTLLVSPRFNRRDAALSVLILTKQPAWKISLYLHRTDDPNKALKACRFVAQDVVQAEQQRITSLAEKKTAARLAELEKARRGRESAKTRAMLQERLFADKELVPLVRQMHYTRGATNRINVQLGRAVYHEGELWTSFFVESTGWQPLRLANIQLANKNGTIIPLRDVYFKPPARAHPEALAEVPPGHRVAGMMRLPGVAEEADPLSITFTGFTGTRMLVATAEEPVWVWVPKREDKLREEQRREAALRAARGMVTLSVQGIYGAIWLGDGAGMERSDATSLKGIGIRASYGITPMIAFEGEVMGAGTGSAHFQEVTFEGMQGDLTRSAGLGRAQFGGVLRFGEGPYVPLARLGVGLQGASHSGTLTTATGEAPGPDSFEWTTFAMFGAGMDVRLGAFRVGIALSVETPWGDYELSRRSIEAGIHLGYAWNP